jgi:hypothetical protein
MVLFEAESSVQLPLTSWSARATCDVVAAKSKPPDTVADMRRDPIIRISILL